MDEDKYIDIDIEKERKGLETESYEQIVLKQLRESAVALSKPRTGGQVIHRVINGKMTTTNIPDTRETAIRTVKTLHSLLKPFIKNKFEDEFTKLNGDKKKMQEELDEEIIKVGNKQGKAKQFTFIPPNHFLIKKRLEKECDITEELFAILVKAFHQSRTEIKAYETD